MSALLNVSLAHIRLPELRLIAGALSIAGLLVTTGCTSLPAKTETSTPSAAAADANQKHLASIEHIQNFIIDGRIGVQTDGRGVSGTIHWQHLDKKDDIAFYSPMGGKIAAVKTTDENVTLTSSDGKTYVASDAETLTQQTLGWRLPVTNLTDWVVGRPTKSAIEKASWDESGKLTKLVQDGWEVEYQEYRDVSGNSLPSKLTLRNPKLYLKLIIERWDTSDNLQVNALK
ncbi:MAG TPA: lipoprotein insertase outer membrane protein LolB [Methylophilaceae bacterium]|nr:lipoprotein insertase outer membrane protein LolB [Methylophilaceae bacterium]